MANSAFQLNEKFCFDILSDSETGVGLKAGYLSSNPENNPCYLLNVDWLEIMCSVDSHNLKELNLPALTHEDMNSPEFADVPQHLIDQINAEKVSRLRGFDLGQIPHSDGFEVWATNGKTRIFSKTFDLFYQGRIIAKVFSNPWKGLLPDDRVKIQFENFLFYTKDFTEIVERSLFHLGLKYESVVRLDVAADTFLPIGNIFTSAFDGLKNLSLSGKSKKSAFRNFGQKIASTFKFGSYSSSRSMTVYNKTEELTHSGKDYISDAHHEFWKDHPQREYLSGDVWRIEARLKRKYLKALQILDAEKGRVFTFENMQLREVLDKDFLQLLLRDTWKGCVGLRIGRNSRVRANDLVDLAGFGDVHLKMFGRVDPGKKMTNYQKHLIKILILQFLYVKNYRRTSSGEYVLNFPSGPLQRSYISVLLDIASNVGPDGVSWIYRKVSDLSNDIKYNGQYLNLSFKSALLKALEKSNPDQNFN